MSRQGASPFQHANATVCAHLSRGSTDRKERPRAFEHDGKVSVWRHPRDDEDPSRRRRPRRSGTRASAPGSASADANAVEGDPALSAADMVCCSIRDDLREALATLAAGVP